MTQQIILGGKPYPIGPLALGQLKRALPAFGRAGAAFARGDLGESALDDVMVILSAGTGIAPAEVELIPATMPEIAAAVEAIARISGLLPEDAPGEGQPAVAAPSTGTTSTAG